ncbi:MAG: UbiX family flavin prenyltransferase [Planctomycetota bacterium]
MVERNPLIVAMTGASGSIYGVQLMRRALALRVPVDLVLSAAAERVLRTETGLAGTTAELCGGAAPDLLQRHAVGDVGAAIASGSYPTRGMVVIPCSMGTAARIAHGISQSLIERAADVQLKEGRRLVAVVRESPLSLVHLKNLVLLKEAGAIVMPASPGFYHRPQTVADLVAFVVDRALMSLELLASPRSVWQGEEP